MPDLGFLQVMSPEGSRDPTTMGYSWTQHTHVDSFAGLFDRFYYMLTGESTSKADKFDNFSRRKSCTCLLHKRALGSAIRDKYWTKPSKQKGVNLDGLGGWKSNIFEIFSLGGKYVPSRERERVPMGAASSVKVGFKVWFVGLWRQMIKIFAHRLCTYAHLVCYF